MTIVLFVFAAVIGFLLCSAILFGVCKIFKISSVSFKRSAYISLVIYISSALLNGILLFFGLVSLSGILSAILIFFMLHYFLKKYYGVSWVKSFGIYLVYIAVWVFVALFVAFFIALPIRFYAFEPFVVSGQSMSPHLVAGDYIIINKYEKDYRRDDVVVFTIPNSNAYLIKRIIGLPSEKIVIDSGVVQVNGIPDNDKYIATPVSGKIDITLATDEYFVLSDNSAPSRDSRTFGPIKKSQIVGTVIWQ